MTTQALTLRLTALSDAHKQTLQFINRLAKLPIQPGSSSLDPNEADARLELSAEIHQSLKDQEEEFELLRQESEDLTNNTSSGGWGSASRRRDSENPSSRTAVAAQVARLGEDLKLYGLPHLTLSKPVFLDNHNHNNNSNNNNNIRV